MLREFKRKAVMASKVMHEYDLEGEERYILRSREYIDSR